jgi:mannitol-1-phosphate/altronate dehydrogenase
MPGTGSSAGSRGKHGERLARRGEPGAFPAGGGAPAGRSSEGKSFAGFGFGPIQNALFLYEAARSGNFSRFAVVDVDRALIEAVRGNGGRYTVNIARQDRIDRDTVEGVELFDSRNPAEARSFVEVLSASDEMCTALPSVSAYPAGDARSVVGLLAAGLSARAGRGNEGMPTVVYTAENNNHAAEILGGHLAGKVPGSVAVNVQFLNTVIGKMSGVISDPGTIERLRLAPLAPGFGRAVLVEEFNRILVSRVSLPGYRRGIEVFVEKNDLLPFEEAKLYGHNAIHALIAYLADIKGYETIAEAGGDIWIMATARGAFIEESGAALIRRHAALGDPLFSESGYTEYAEDLLRRMTNPHLNDRVDRVGRDHPRKLAIDDRLYGTMSLALEQEVAPERLALGAAAGIVSMIRRRDTLTAVPRYLPTSAGDLTGDAVKRLLWELWGESEWRHRFGEALVHHTLEGLRGLRDQGLL